MTSGHEMCGEIHDWVIENIPKKSIILELGSGKGTKRLVDNDYTVYSVEHNPKWMNRYGSNYIHATIKDGWYDPKVIEEQLPNKYDLLIVYPATVSLCFRFDRRLKTCSAMNWAENCFLLEDGLRF